MACILCRTGLGMTKRKAVYSPGERRCYVCKRPFDLEILGSSKCPGCNRKLKPAVSHYRIVCIQCGEIVAN